MTKSNRGGKRPGSGRKSKENEIKVRGIALKAIEKKYGSLEKGLIWLLESQEATLIKFVFEHAVGKPREQVAVDGDISVEWNETKVYKKK